MERQNKSYYWTSANRFPVSWNLTHQQTHLSELT